MPKRRRTLRELRAKKKLNQGQVADELGLDVSQVSRYEAGRASPTLAGFRAMAKLYGVTYNELFAALDLAFSERRRQLNEEEAA